jgi:OmpA-OmpF porin, OOP family
MRRAVPATWFLCMLLFAGCWNQPGPTFTPASSGGGSDRDGDGIADAVDKCPDAPEDFDGFEDEDGCPEPDNDHDGVLDLNDRCPNEPGPGVNGGCPFVANSDRDADGVADQNDKCPDDPEDRDGFQDSDGCPDPDNDGDGILDVNDKCPMEPGPVSKGGCP